MVTSYRVLPEALTLRCSVKKVVLRNFAKLIRKHLCQSLFFNKVSTLLKKKLWHKCFPANYAIFLKTSFLTEHLRWLLLSFIGCTVIGSSLGSSVIGWFSSPLGSSVIESYLGYSVIRSSLGSSLGSSVVGSLLGLASLSILCAVFSAKCWCFETKRIRNNETKLRKTEKNMEKENNSDKSDSSENEISDLDSLKAFEFEPKTNIGEINS